MQHIFSSTCSLHAYILTLAYQQLVTVVSWRYRRERTASNIFAWLSREFESYTIQTFFILLLNVYLFTRWLYKSYAREIRESCQHTAIKYLESVTECQIVPRSNNSILTKIRQINQLKNENPRTKHPLVWVRLWTNFTKGRLQSDHFFHMHSRKKNNY